MKTEQEIFKDVLEELGFAGYKPSQMTNSDYWLCTTTAMKRYAHQALDDAAEKEKTNLMSFLGFAQNVFYEDGFQNYENHKSMIQGWMEAVEEIGLSILSLKEKY